MEVEVEGVGEERAGRYAVLIGRRTELQRKRSVETHRVALAANPGSSVVESVLAAPGERGAERGLAQPTQRMAVLARIAADVREELGGQEDVADDGRGGGRGHR